MRGKISEFFMMIYPEIDHKYITDNNKEETVLYVKALNTKYGIMKVAPIFYKKFVGDITFIGLKLNPYYSCISKKLTNSKQMTTVWYIDDLKVSHKIRKS